MKKTPAKRAAETRKFYAFEHGYIRNDYLMKPRRMSEMRRLANKVWKTEGFKRPLPRLIAGDGVYQNGRWLSYCEWDFSHITFCRNQRNYQTLLHELVHAIGPEYHDHNTRFVRKLFDLLVKYGKCDLEELVFAAQTSGIRITLLPESRQ